jgi:hypothetical protein
MLVLITEDRPRMTQLLERALKREGHTVTLAFDVCQSPNNPETRRHLKPKATIPKPYRNVSYINLREMPIVYRRVWTLGLSLGSIKRPFFLVPFNPETQARRRSEKIKVSRSTCSICVHVDQPASGSPTKQGKSYLRCRK